jgi:hypothetical protein
MHQAAMLDSIDAMYSLNYGKALPPKAITRMQSYGIVKPLKLTQAMQMPSAEPGACYSELKRL